MSWVVAAVDLEKIHHTLTLVSYSRRDENYMKSPSTFFPNLNIKSFIISPFTKFIILFYYFKVCMMLLQKLQWSMEGVIWI